MAEYARYQWFWDARTRWLAEHSDERQTERYRANWEKRQQMTVRFNELRELVIEHGRIVQACALYLGDDARDRLRDEYGLDFTRTGDTLDVFLRQWAAHLTFNPEPVPF